MCSAKQVLSSIVLLSAVRGSGAERAVVSDTFETVAKFQKVMYTFDDADATMTEEQYLAGEIWKTNVFAGMKKHGDDIFVTVPRWAPNVLATMNKLVFQDGEPLFQPWPSWAMNEWNNCAALQFTQSMEIDNNGVMWIIDTGAPAANWEPRGTCPPKMVLIDIATETVVDTYTFPESVVSREAGGCWLNDIVVDVERNIAYISDLNGGQIVVYDREGRSRAWADASTKAVEGTIAPIVINGVFYESGPSPGAGIDGIALPRCRDRVYFCTLQGLNMFSVDAQLLSDFDSTDDSIRDTLQSFSKPGMADGLAFDDHDKLYMGAISNSTEFNTEGNAVHSFNINDDSWVREAEDAGKLHWADTFAFDNGNEKLLVTVNRLDLFFNNKTKFWDETFNTAESPNFHIISIPIGAKSYIEGQSNCPDDGAGRSSLVGCIAIIMFSVFLRM